MAEEYRLTHLSLDKMAAISQKTLSKAFLWMRSFAFWLSGQLTKPSKSLNNGLAPKRRQAIIWSNADPIHWRKYAALGGNELNYICLTRM